MPGLLLDIVVLLLDTVVLCIPFSASVRLGCGWMLRRCAAYYHAMNVGTSFVRVCAATASALLCACQFPI